MGKVISVLGASSKILDSIITVNMTLALAGFSRKNIILLDLSRENTNQIEFLMGHQSEKKLGDIIKNLDRLDEKLLKGFIPIKKDIGVGIVAKEKDFDFGKTSVHEINCLIDLLANVFDGVVINAQEQSQVFLEAIVNNSDCIISTIDHNLLSLNQMQNYFAFLKAWHFSLNRVKLFLVKSNSKTDLKKERIEKMLGVNLAGSIPYLENIIENSINEGVPLIIKNPHNIIARELKQAACDIWQAEKQNKEIKLVNKSKSNLETGQADKKIFDYNKLRNKIHKLLITELNIKNIDLKALTDSTQVQEVKNTTRQTIQDLIAFEDIELSRQQKEKFVEDLLNEVLGLGCLEKLLKDPDITEIMVNGPDRIYIEKKGKLRLSDVKFSSREQLSTVIDRIVAPIGRRVDEAVPLVDARLLDGSRVNIIIPPLALDGSTITIRKFSESKLGINDLIGFGALSEDMGKFLDICVKLKKNIVISGGTGSGKTTLLNVVSSFIPCDERIVTIEDSAELRLPQDHVVRLESRPASLEGTGAIPIRRLVINSLRMRPDRIVVGECRGGETLDMLQAMNTGHDGSLTTLHSNNTKDAVSRIATMVIMAGTELPEKAIREQIASAVHMIIQLNRLSDGSRKIMEIAEICGIENDKVKINPIFKFNQHGIENEKVVGSFDPTGNTPSFADEIQRQGLELDTKIFTKEFAKVKA